MYTLVHKLNIKDKISGYLRIDMFRSEKRSSGNYVSDELKYKTLWDFEIQTS